MSNFTISRHFSAPRKLVYECWVNPEHLARWCYPDTCESCDLVAANVGEGGFCRQRIKFADAPSFCAQFSIKKLSPIDSLELVTFFCDESGTPARHPFVDDWPERLLTLVTLQDEGDGTRVTVEWVPIEASDAELARFALEQGNCNAGWTGSFNQLERLLSELVPA